MSLAPPESDSGSRRSRLIELAKLFLRLGTTAFGGPAVHLALLEDEAVTRRGWLSRAEFLDMLGATNLIPGPNSTEMAMHLGQRRAGLWGLLVAGCSFILPAALIVAAIAAAYVRWSSLPEVEGMLYGIKPMMIAVVLQALARLSSTLVRSKLLIAVALLAIAALLLGLHELWVLALCGLVVVLCRTKRRPTSTVLPALIAPPSAGLFSLGAASAAVPLGLGPLFWFFLKVGSVLFGSGYVLLAFLRADLVERWHWLTEGQLLDAIAVGQVTPGPVFTTATFIGYLLAGPWGAVVSTVAIFLPAFFFVGLSAPLIPRLRQSTLFGNLLDGVNAGSLALMAVVTGQLARTAIVDFPTLLLAVVGAGLLLIVRCNATWLVLLGAISGWLLYG